MTWELKNFLQKSLNQSQLQAQVEQRDNMFLFELDGPDPLLTKIVTVSDQLKSLVDKGSAKDWTLDQLKAYFQKYDVSLDQEDLYNMIKKAPLKNVISNIQGDKVIFKGSEAPTSPDADDNQKVVNQMAHNAMK
jgi:hypothetical protein